MAEFEISAGKYDVVVVGPGKRYSISQLSAEGAEVVGHVINLAAGASPSLSVTVTAGGVAVRGTVKKAAKPFPGAMVVLIPRDPQGNHDLFRRDQSDLDGTFDLRGVVPGSYTVAAIENGWDLNWAETDLIAGYAKHGQKIQVAAQSGSSLNISDIPVPSK
ncbi:MAG TPA: carboxypeptidase-like regulatory domain-containing protein [Blastocatellia bacterium]|nr:carboxypeptidase-like regulatory domain-containing protein [Blastocatellia bacterium]